MLYMPWLNVPTVSIFVCLFVCWVICFQVASILAAYLRCTRLRDPNHPRLGKCGLLKSAWLLTPYHGVPLA